MTKDGWRSLLVKAFDESINHHDQTFLDSIAQELADADQAKQLLHDAGFGVTGTSLLLSVREALEDVGLA